MSLAGEMGIVAIVAITWGAVGLVIGYLYGSAAKLGGCEDPRREETKTP